MKKVTVSELISWNGVDKTLSEFIEALEKKSRLDDRHAKLLSDLIVAHNNFASVSDDEYDFDNL